MSHLFNPKSDDSFIESYTEPDFDLIETFLWEEGAYFLLDLHMERFERSADHFSFAYNITEITDFLNHAVFSFDKTKKYRVRLLTKKTGKLQLSSQELDMPDKTPVKVILSTARTDRADEFLYHKTTNRKLYDHEFTKYRSNGFFDVIFMNNEGEVTEGAISNIIVRKGDTHFTPPVSCGLLPGVYREYLLEIREDIIVKEKALFPEDLKNADEIFMINSVRKKMPAVLSA
ncbi:MAG: aminotransferase class IV [Candidatus Omnitrophota bacterium]